MSGLGSGEVTRAVRDAGDDPVSPPEAAAASPVPSHIRHTHWAGFRSGQWAEILTIAPAENRDCYVVRFPDGTTDFWVRDDPDDPYEFAWHNPQEEPA